MWRSRMADSVLQRLFMRFAAAVLAKIAARRQARFDRSGVQKEIDEAIDVGRDAVAATPAGHPARARRLNMLGTALHARFGRTWAQADLDAAIEAFHAAVDATPPGRPLYLCNLGVALQTRFERMGALADLDAAIEAGQAAVDATPPGHPSRALYLTNLGNSLQARFGRTGALADLDAAIKAGQAAVDATRPRHPDRVLYLFNLGTAMQLRFERTGALADLDAAIEAGQAAVDATPPGHPDRALFLSNLGTGMQLRFERMGALADLDAAIEAFQAAVDATPPGHPDLVMYLSNLAAALHARFGRTGALADLDAAIKAGRAAVDAASPGRPDQQMSLSNLGIALRTRFERMGALADLDAAIEAGQAAVDATPPGHLDRAVCLTNLGNSLQARFGRTGALADLDAAIKAGQAAVDATPPGHPRQALCLTNLASALQRRFERTGAPPDRDAAGSVCAEAAELDAAAPSVRIKAARAAASLLAQSEPDRAAGLLELAVRLLPEVASRRLGRSDQQHALGGLAGLASDAAALALGDHGSGAASSERASRALGLLEAGRAVLLSQALDTRSDLTDLRSQHPGLAARFTELRNHLDQPEDTSRPGTSQVPISAAVGREEERRQLVGEFMAILGEIRALEGFASFGLPPTTGELLAEATSGPVVTFNVSAYGGSALLLTEDGITSLELPALAYETVIGQIRSFYQAVMAAADAGGELSDRRAAQKKLLEILGWLWDAAAGPVLDALGCHQPPPPGVMWPRVWWAPGGLLGVLPLHAVGHHTEPLSGDQTRRTVMDRVISSSTPTIRALRYARQHPPALPTGRALIVGMPVTPGLPGGGELPNVPMEIAQLSSLLPDPVLLAEPGTSADKFRYAPTAIPTRENVLGQLPSCAIVHFACHGRSDPADPSKSLLLLHDHDRYPLTVTSLASVNLGQAQLAYLSACETALGASLELIDEAIHLTTAFQLAGFPHVIGTLWEIDDELAVTIAGAFYTALRASDGTLDTSRAAVALHHAIRAARDRFPATPSLWAAYLHAGA